MSTEKALIKGRYQMGRLIGGGGMGEVYLGTDLFTGETVAIKQLRAEMARDSWGGMPDMVERFMREGEVLRRLDHPNIVKVLATADEGSRHYIVMEYVGGGSLADLLAKLPKLPFGRVVLIGLELADALSRAHHLQILHRDIKPGNILLAEDGAARLTDFGLALVGQLPRLTGSLAVLGTLYYLSPEALEKREVNERSDLWSFGVVLYEMLAGRLPFDGETPFDVIWAIKNYPPRPLEDLREGIPPGLVSLVKRMLRKDNPARVDSARQVGAELEAIRKELGPGQASAVAVGTLAAAAQPAPAKKIRVVIVDDHVVVRQGLRMFIDLQEDMEVVGEGSTGVEAVELASQLSPDLMLLDLVMPRMDGVTATSKIKAACPGTRVIILTSFGEDDKVLPAIRAGAQGYLLKDIHPDQLVQAVREAYQGKTQLHPDIAQKLMALVTGNSPAPPAPPVQASKEAVDAATALLKTLTKREQAILRLVADGKSNHEIAEQIGLSEKTVRMRISSILTRLDLQDRAQAAAWANKHL